MAAQHVGLEGGWKALAGSPNSVRTGPAGRSGRKVTVRPRSAPERRVAVVLMDWHGGGWGRVRGPTLFQGPRQSPPEVARSMGGLPYLFWGSPPFSAPTLSQWLQGGQDSVVFQNLP